MTGIDRRLFLRRSAAAGGLLLAPSLTGLIACTADRPLEPGGTPLPPLKRAGRGEGGYGELVPSSQVDGMISIPEGFHAALLSTAGEEMIGGAVPNAFDGMAATQGDHPEHGPLRCAQGDMRLLTAAPPPPESTPTPPPHAAARWRVGRRPA